MAALIDERPARASPNPTAPNSGIRAGCFLMLENDIPCMFFSDYDRSIYLTLIDTDLSSWDET